MASFLAGLTRGFWWNAAKLDLRMISCLCLVLAAWIAWRFLCRTPSAFGMFLIAIGMTLGFYGDSHVGDRLWWPPFPNKIIGGIVFYGLGHLAYVAACLSIQYHQRLAGGLRWWRWVCIWQVVAIISWAAVALTSGQATALRIPTLLYTLLVAATPGFTTALAVQQPKFRGMALGGAMFLASDILLAWQIFHASFPGCDELTWINYGGGEMLIVYGAIAGLWPQSVRCEPSVPAECRPRQKGGGPAPLLL